MKLDKQSRSSKTPLKYKPATLTVDKDEFEYEESKTARPQTSKNIKEKRLKSNQIAPDPSKSMVMTP